MDGAPAEWITAGHGGGWECHRKAAVCHGRLSREVLAIILRGGDPGVVSEQPGRVSCFPSHHPLPHTSPACLLLGNTPPSPLNRHVVLFLRGVVMRPTCGGPDFYFLEFKLFVFCSGIAD